MKTHKRQTPSKLLGRQSLGGGISRFTPMEKGGGLKPALWSRGLWRRIKRQRRRGLERQEASSKRCWSQKENKREGPKKDGHRRRKDPWMRRRCGDATAEGRKYPPPVYGPYSEVCSAAKAQAKGGGTRMEGSSENASHQALFSTANGGSSAHAKTNSPKRGSSSREQLQYQNQLENLSLPGKRQQ